jgi:hypothetical protein
MIFDTFVEPDWTALIKSFERLAEFSVVATSNESGFARTDNALGFGFTLRLTNVDSFG